MKTKTLLISMFIFTASLTSVVVAQDQAPTIVPTVDDPTLKITFEKTTREFKRSELLSSGSVQQITVPEDPAYPGVKMTYSAVPARQLFDNLNIPHDATIQFVCLDGFSAPLTLDRLLNGSAQGSIPYIAVEPPAQKWPGLKAGDPKSAGPFYLIWSDPEKSHIATEEWPFQLAGFEIQPPVRDLYPKIVPDATASSHVGHGFNLFVQNCFACHTMNGQGNSKMGPDLNLPYSPTEYLKNSFIVKLIRNPQNMRRWPESRMATNFTPEKLPDSDLNDLIAYLKFMSKHKAD